MTKFKKTLFSIILSTVTTLLCFSMSLQKPYAKAILNEANGSYFKVHAYVNLSSQLLGSLENQRIGAKLFAGLSVYTGTATLSNSNHNLSVPNSTLNIGSVGYVIVWKCRVGSWPSDGKISIQVPNGYNSYGQEIFKVLGVYAGNNSGSGSSLATAPWIYICCQYTQLSISNASAVVAMNSNWYASSPNFESFIVGSSSFYNWQSSVQTYLNNNSSEQNSKYNIEYLYESRDTNISNYNYTSVVNETNITVPVVDSSDFTTYMDYVEPKSISAFDNYSVYTDTTTSVSGKSGYYNNGHIIAFDKLDNFYNSHWICIKLKIIGKNDDYLDIDNYHYLSDYDVEIKNFYMRQDFKQYNAQDIVTFIFDNELIIYINTFSNYYRDNLTQPNNDGLFINYDIQSNYSVGWKLVETAYNTLYYTPYTSNLGLQISQMVNNLTNIRYGLLFENISNNTDTIVSILNEINNTLSSMDETPAAPTEGTEPTFEYKVMEVIDTTEDIIDDMKLDDINLTDNKYNVVDINTVDYVETMKDTSGDLIEIMEDNGAGIFIWLPLILLIIGVII